MSEDLEWYPLTMHFEGVVKVVENLLVCESQVGNIKLRPASNIHGVITLMRKKLFGWFDFYHLAKYKPILHRALMAQRAAETAKQNLEEKNAYQEDEPLFDKSEQKIFKLNFEGVVKIEADELIVESWVGETKLSDQRTKINGETSGFVNPSLCIHTALAAIELAVRDWLKKIDAHFDADGNSLGGDDSPS